MIRLLASFASAVAVVFALSLAALAQTPTKKSTVTIEGEVRDPQGRLAPGTLVILEDGAFDKSSHKLTDSQGHFQFDDVLLGSYTLRAISGQYRAEEGPFEIHSGESKTIQLLLREESSKAPVTDLPFSDETHFTVAGVTDTTSLGGHGSDPVRRNSDALSKDAVRLSNTSVNSLDESAVRERLAGKDDADLRFQLAELEEKSGRSLDAANDYQHSAELAPTEAHLFAWGAELLLHRAFDPSIEVFRRGWKLYPGSVRMLLGLGSATYAKGSTDEAKRIFLQACDVNPSEATPYLFLGRVQMTETQLPPGWTDRLKRFAELYPDSPKSHYFYAVALTKKPSTSEALALAASQLKTAVDLDPHFGDAYLELGILASEQGDRPEAVAYLQKAVENTPLPDDAHYRLAQVYRRMGETEKAHQETQLYKQISEKKKLQVEQDRRELQQFVYTLRGQGLASDAH